MSHPPRYDIRTVHDFAKVPHASRQTCLREFAEWLEMMDALIRAMAGIPIEPPKAFVWIDDGKHEATVTLTDGEQRIHVASGVMRGFE